ncbi:MAG: helix-turn-helix domain-containing protein, partial [Patescibacteria group bacterium]
RVGHVLQGRYKAFIIEKEIYLHAVIRYVVLNAVRAGLVRHPKDWKWCSYNATAGHKKIPEWLEVNFTLSLFSDKLEEARMKYRQFVKEGIGAGSPFDEIKEGIILGSPQFVGWIWEEFQDSEEIREVVISERMIGRPSLADLFYGARSLEDRGKAIYIARVRGAYSITEIADHLGLHRSTVSKIFNKYDQTPRPTT